MATTHSQQTKEVERQVHEEELRQLYQAFVERPYQAGDTVEAKRLLGIEDCEGECLLMARHDRGEFTRVVCAGKSTDGRCDNVWRLWKNGSGPSGGWAAGDTNHPETTAAKVLHAIDVLELAGVGDIIEVSGLSHGAVSGCLRRLSSSKSGQAWVEKLSVEGAFGRRVAYRLTPRGELRLDWDREAGLAPEVDDDDDDQGATEEEGTESP